MDLTTTIIGLALFLLALFPLFIAINSRKKKSKKLKMTFDDFITRHQLQLTEQETWDDRRIGLDAVKKQVVFVAPALPEGAIIALEEVATCELSKTAEKNEAGFETEIAEKLGLLFTFKEPGQEDLYLPFYDNNSDDPLQISYSRKRISKWQQLIEKHSPKRAGSKVG